MDKKVYSERMKLLRSVEKLLEIPMIFLAFVWLVLLVIELLWGLSSILEYLSLAIWIIFIIDFLIKFILAPGKTTYLRKNWLTAISLIIPALRILRILRIVRVIRGVRVVRIISSLNRSTRSLAATMQRRAIAYVLAVSLLVVFGGAAGMYALENPNPGFQDYGMALWWTAMRVITAGNEFFPVTPEGRTLGFVIAVFGYTIFGYMTATFATYFIGRDAEEKTAPVAGKKDIDELKKIVSELSAKLASQKKAV
jgi:voltage-gated potassium channel